MILKFKKLDSDYAESFEEDMTELCSAKILRKEVHNNNTTTLVFEIDSTKYHPIVTYKNNIVGFDLEYAKDYYVTLHVGIDSIESMQIG